MALDPTAVTSRSNSDLLAIKMTAENTALSAEERMVLIARTVAAWDKATTGSTGRYGAEKITEARRYPKPAA